ncbi:hypothetical protein ABIF66_000516 [Bradyrhizobium japonicum]|uniref:Uncharacterized protein n=1 Tax=Bradyrhizobium barranii subsp. barranii TaxID=2823807 RepID=A0A7Z0Q809_9BRAD|nr:hypothetical protein [Bradyrhizobium barranii]UGX95263.1 hypothetical protein G6321_00008990 [Bradyrhizobium barranii subsp. barranii]
MMQRADIVSSGIPPRGELEAMAASPSSTDARAWLTELLKARACLEVADSLEDGSQRFSQLIDFAQDIEGAAIQAFLSVPA